MTHPALTEEEREFVEGICGYLVVHDFQGWAKQLSIIIDRLTAAKPAGEPMPSAQDYRDAAGLVSPPKQPSPSARVREIEERHALVMRDRAAGMVWGPLVLDYGRDAIDDRATLLSIIRELQARPERKVDREKLRLLLVSWGGDSWGAGHCADAIIAALASSELMEGE